MVIDEDLVRALVAEVLPRWAHLPVRQVLPGGHDNRTFRLGDELAVRLPSAERYTAAVEREQRWLPVLAAALPLPIPEPVALGRPAADFPWPWSVNRWIAGETAITAAVPDPSRFATDVAGFLTALHAVDTTDAPPAGEHNFHRGGDLVVYRDEADAVLATLPDGGLVAWAGGVLDRALGSSWDRPAVWVHGDVAVGNLLVRDGRLAAVIDFGGCAVGDPASDLVLAWTFLDHGAAEAFREAVRLDQATWDRAAGWALWKALITLDDPGSRRTIARLREDLP
ncbi:aminoglycoside phosphotransferase family protein [Amnibacterium soli]|uniref:Aminoglycoside phosphotransferase family protein n=1 Tax=Amnibacterium soli TaxID=1282736 RepID=A0ABP8Z348_9MICO